MFFSLTYLPDSNKLKQNFRKNEADPLTQPMICLIGIVYSETDPHQIS